MRPRFLRRHVHRRLAVAAPGVPDAFHVPLALARRVANWPPGTPVTIAEPCGVSVMVEVVGCARSDPRHLRRAPGPSDRSDVTTDQLVRRVVRWSAARYYVARAGWTRPAARPAHARGSQATYASAHVRHAAWPRRASARRTCKRDQPPLTCRRTRLTSAQTSRASSSSRRRP